MQDMQDIMQDKFINFCWNSHCLQSLMFNPLPDDKILDWSKLKQIANVILKRI